MKKKFRLFLLVTVLFSVGAAGQVEFYVSPSGSDRNVGTIDRPFATIARGRDASAVGAEGRGQDVTSRRGAAPFSRGVNAESTQELTAARIPNPRGSIEARADDA